MVDRGLDEVIAGILDLGWVHADVFFQDILYHIPGILHGAENIIGIGGQGPLKIFHCVFLYDKNSSQRGTNQKEKSMVHFWTHLLHSWWRGISSRSWPYVGNILHFPESKSNIVPIAGPYIILIKFTHIPTVKHEIIPN